MKWPTGHCCCNKVTRKPFVATSQTAVVKAELWLDRGLRKVFLTYSFDASEVYTIARQSPLSWNKAVSVVRILKFDNPIRSEKFQWYPNPILIRKFCSKHNPIQIQKSKSIIIPDSNHNNNFFAIFVKFSNYIGNRQAQNQEIW